MTEFGYQRACSKQVTNLSKLLRKYGVDPQEFFKEQRGLAKALVAFFVTLEEGGETHGNH